MLKTMLHAVLRPLARRWARGQVPRDLAAGDLCAISASGAGFAVLKVLAVDSDGVHVRVYKQRFTSLPAALDSTQLSLGVFKVDGSPSDPFSIGHLPITREGLGLSRPVRLASIPVLTEELDGYQIWQESHGGYFTGPIL